MIQWKITDIRQGLKLRSAGMSYGGIAIVMREYHDLAGVTEGAVRHQLRTHGAVGSPRGSQAQLRSGQSGRLRGPAPAAKAAA